MAALARPRAPRRAARPARHAPHAAPRPPGAALLRRAPPLRAAAALAPPLPAAADTEVKGEKSVAAFSRHTPFRGGAGPAALANPQF